MENQEQLLIAIGVRQNQLDREMKRLAQTVGTNLDRVERRGKQAGQRLESSLTGASTRIAASFKSMAAGLLAGASVNEAQRLLDTSTRIDNALKVAGLSGEKLVETRQRLFESAQKNAAPLETLVQLYSRATLVQNDLGASQERLLSFTDKIGVALRVAGTDAGQASGALLQLSQLLGSGTVRAEEFNSVQEGALPILQAVAAGLKEAGGSVSTLRSLVIAGKVSSKAFFDAFEAGASVLQNKVAGSELTISQAFVRLQNVLIDTAKRFDDSTDASRILVKILDNHLTPALQEVGSIFTGLSTGPIADFIAYVGQATDAILQLSADIGAMTGLDEVGRKFGAKPFVSQGRIQDRIDGAFEGTAAPKADRLPTPGHAPAEITVTKGNAVKPISLADYPLPASSSGRSAGRASKASEDGYAREVEQIQKRLALLRLETAAQAGVNPLINDYGAAVEKARMKQQLLNAAQEAGHKITPELESSIDALAQSYADASTDAAKLADDQDKARQSAEDWASAGKDMLGGFLSDLRQGKSLTEALSNAFNKLLDKLQEKLVDTLFDGLSGGGGIFGWIGKLLGFAKGGVVNADAWAGLRLAGGGHVRGPGTSKSDSIPAMLSDGEFVVNAAATAKHRALLEAVNDNRIPAFATGGIVGKAPALASAIGGTSVTVAPTINVSVEGGSRGPEADKALAAEIGKRVEGGIRGLVADELRQQMRPGNMLNQRSY